MRIMIIGAAGMAGHMVYNYLCKRSDMDITSVSYNTKLNDNTVFFDFYRRDKVIEFLKVYQPEIIINCIGVLIKEANEHPEKAIYTNSFLPHFLSKTARENNSKLIHLSTDCVFSGKSGMYQANDPKDAQDIYGMSKALGEIINDNDLTIRTSIIGPELKSAGQGLLHWFLNQKGNINGYTEAYWSGITTLQLAKLVEQCIDHNQTGLLQYSNGIKISKFELLSIFRDVWHKDEIHIHPIPGKKIDKSLYPSINMKISPAPSYVEMCTELREYMYINQEIYRQYI